MRDDELLRRFLLGELKEDDAERVEARLLEEDELFDLCEAVEADLLQAVARGELAPAERDRVLKRLASSPQGRSRLALARGLTAFADGKRSPESLPAPLPYRRPAAFTMRPAVRWAIAAGLAAILLGGIGGGIWSFLAKSGTGDQGHLAMQVPPREQDPRPGQRRTIPRPHRVPAAPNSGQTDPGGAIPPRPTHEDPGPNQTEPEPPARAPLVFELSLLTLRSGEDPEELEKIRIPSGRDVELHVLDVTIGGYDSYDAVVRRGEEEPFRLNPTLVEDDLVLDLPASALPAGRYELEVYGNPAEGTPELLVERELEISGGG